LLFRFFSRGLFFFFTFHPRQSLFLARVFSKVKWDSLPLSPKSSLSLRRWHFPFLLWESSFVLQASIDLGVFQNLPFLHRCDNVFSKSFFYSDPPYPFSSNLASTGNFSYWISLAPGAIPYLPSFTSVDRFCDS